MKAYFVPLAGIAYFVWAIRRAHGIGPIVHQGGTAHGSELAWGMVKGIMSSIANFATLIVNDPDFARFARKPRDALWSQFFTIPLGFAVTSFIGIIVSSSSAVIFPPKAIWNPLDLLSLFLNGANSGERFGVFIIAFAFALAQLGTNIAANSVSAGTDMTALLPRYLNIRRGGENRDPAQQDVRAKILKSEQVIYAQLSVWPCVHGTSFLPQTTLRPTYLPTRFSSPRSLESSFAIIIS